MHKEVLVQAKDGAFIYCVVLVSGTNDHPGQFGANILPMHELLGC